MRIALFTTGRFWLLTLAREFTRMGHEARLYSLVPPHHTARHGLPKQCNRWLGPFVAPQYGVERLLHKTIARPLVQHSLVASLDAVAARRIEPCDVLIAMSGIGLRALDTVKQKYGAKVFVERASRHILSQREVVDDIRGMQGKSPSTPKMPAYVIHRELAGYQLADKITVPSRHVEESFLERGFEPNQLFRNRFGANLDNFRPTPAPPRERPTILMVGTWCYRKGCDVLVEAWRKLADENVRLLHVGPVTDAPLPPDAGFEHIDAVPEATLLKFYAESHVFALASREEGLALVQVQALACGLPLVCTDRTGGGDLRDSVVDPSLITEVPHNDVDALAAGLRAALANTARPGVTRDAFGDQRRNLSWTAYAERYERALRQAVKSS